MLVEEKKEETKLEQRERHQKLEKDIEQGRYKTKNIDVLNASGDWREQSVHAIGSGELQECLDTEDMTWNEFAKVIKEDEQKKMTKKELEEMERLAMRKMRVYRRISAKAMTTKTETWTYTDVCRELGLGAEVLIALTCLQLTGLLEAPTADQMALFRGK